MTANSDAAFSSGNMPRELRKLQDRVSALEAARTLESASIGAGGLSVKGGSIVIYDAQGDEQMRLSTAGLSLTGLLAVLGSIRATDGSISAADSSGDVFRVDPTVPEIFMRPELISAVARQVIAEVIYTDEVATFQSTSSTSYTDLSTVGPTLSDVEISDTGRMLVFVSAFINPAHNTSTGQLNEFGYMSYEISGPTNRAANDADALIAGLGTTVTSGDVSAGLFCDATKVSVEEGLSPGTYTIQAKYKTEATLGGTPTTDFGARRLTVIAF